MANMDTCLSIPGHFLWLHLLYVAARLEQIPNVPKKPQDAITSDPVDPGPLHSVKQILRFIYWI